MPDPNFITLPWHIERDAPSFVGDGLQSPDSLIRYFLKRYTERGDRVFDPFAGLGTSLFAAEAMGRIPFGIEADERRQQWVAGQMRHWTNLAHGDSAQMNLMGFPKMDFCITCPPYMRKDDKWNPLYAGNPERAGYKAYLTRMKFIFRQLSTVMKRNAVIVVQVDNLPGKVFTPLVADLGTAISTSLRQENEIIVAWDGGRKEYRHTHCLVFKNTAP
ncbi:MAG: DNA methyltransferase [Micavibrio sp.]